MENDCNAAHSGHIFSITKVPVVGVGVCLTVVLPSGQATATAQAVLLILFVLDAVALET